MDWRGDMVVKLAGCVMKIGKDASKRLPEQWKPGCRADWF
jgi:hypothetical protein